MMRYYFTSAFALLLLFLPSLAQDLTVTWGDEIQLTDYYAFSDVPQIAVWNDAVYAVWQTAFHAGPARVMICASFDRGDTWTRNNPVSPWIYEFVDDIVPAVAVWGRYLRVVMREYNIPSGYEGIVYSASSDYGRTWSNPPIEMLEECSQPSISIWKNYVNLVGLDAEGTIHRISTDGGLTFQPPDTLSPLLGGFHAGEMLAYRNYVFLVYPALSDSTNMMEVFFHRSTDLGVTFTPFLTLSTGDPWPSQRPAMSITRQGDVYVAWMDYKYSNTGDILLRHSPDYGANWEDELQITYSHYSKRPSISSDGSQVHIVWTDERLGGSEDELYYKNSNDYGWSWSDEIRLTTAHDRSTFSDLAQKGDTLHLVWYDERQTVGSQIYYRRGVIEHEPAERSVCGSISDLPQPAVMNLHPNPFNPTTIISYNLPSATNVDLTVYDVAGRMVAQLVDGWRSAGTHDVTFDASTLPSGLYFYRFTAGKTAATGKMVLLK